MTLPKWFFVGIFASLFWGMVRDAISETTPAEPRTLEGKWQSDKEKTMTFNKTHAKLTEKQAKFLEQLFGHMTLEFDKSQFKIYMPAEATKIAKQNLEPDDVSNTFPYTVLGATNDAVAIKSTGELGEKVESLKIWNFEDDYIWTYIGDTPYGKFHLREYFRRVK